MINTVMLHNEHIFGTGSIFKFGGIHESYIVVISFVLSGSSVGYFLSKVNPVDGMQLQQSFLEGILVSVLSTTSMAIWELLHSIDIWELSHSIDIWGVSALNM